MENNWHSVTILNNVNDRRTKLNVEYINEACPVTVVLIMILGDDEVDDALDDDGILCVALSSNPPIITSV